VSDDRSAGSSLQHWQFRVDAEGIARCETCGEALGVYDDSNREATFDVLAAHQRHWIGAVRKEL